MHSKQASNACGKEELAARIGHTAHQPMVGCGDVRQRLCILLSDGKWKVCEWLFTCSPDQLCCLNRTVSSFGKNNLIG